MDDPLKSRRKAVPTPAGALFTMRLRLTTLLRSGWPHSQVISRSAAPTLATRCVVLTRDPEAALVVYKHAWNEVVSAHRARVAIEQGL